MNREGLRQQMLLRALWRDDAALQGWVRAPARASAVQGVAAYRGNAGALAERGLVRPLLAPERAALATAQRVLHCFNCGAPADGAGEALQHVETSGDRGDRHSVRTL